MPSVGSTLSQEEISMLNDQAVGAYLERIGRTAPLTADQAGLRDLHKAHQLAVPFENLSIHLPEPISLDEDHLIGKIIARRRGGFCYELNGAFALLLESLGAQVRRVGAKVYGEDNKPQTLQRFKDAMDKEQDKSVMITADPDGNQMVLHRRYAARD